MPKSAHDDAFPLKGRGDPKDVTFHGGGGGVDPPPDRVYAKVQRYWWKYTTLSLMDLVSVPLETCGVSHLSVDELPGRLPETCHMLPLSTRNVVGVIESVVVCNVPFSM